MKLIRQLKDPRRVLVNGKKVEIAAFRKVTASLGMIRNDNFSVNMLLETELNRIKHTSGEDLWQIIAKVINCRELIEILETKQHHNALINSEVRFCMRDMEVMLPIKLKMRDEFRAFHKLRIDFNALMSILEKRNLKVIKNNQKNINKELARVKDELEEFRKAEFESRKPIKLNELNMIKLDQHKSIIGDLRIQTASSILNINMMKAKSSGAEWSLEEKTRRILETVTKFRTNLEQINNHAYHVMSGEVKAIKVRIAIKKGQSSVQQLRKSLENVQQGMNFMSKRLLEYNNGILAATENLNQVTFSPQQRMADILTEQLNIDKEQVESKLRLVDTDKTLQQFAFENHLEVEYLNALLKIESIIRSDESIYRCYVGPMFIHIKDEQIDSELWPKLIEVSKVLIFSQGAVARKLMKMLKESNAIPVPISLVGVDEFVAKAPQADTNVYETLDHLIDENERSRDFLTSFLHEFVVVDGKNFDSKLGELHTALIQMDCGSVARSQGIAEFCHENMETFENLKQAYKIIKKHALLQLEITKKDNVKNQLKQAFDDLQKAEVVASPSLILENSKQLVYLTKLQLNTVKYLEMSRFTIIKCNEILAQPNDNMDVAQLTDLLRTKLASMFETEAKVWEPFLMEISSPIEELANEYTALENLSKTKLRFFYPWSDEQEAVLKLYEDFHDELEQKSTECKTEWNRLLAQKEFYDKSTIVRDIDLRYKVCIERVKQQQVDEIATECEEFTTNCTSGKFIRNEKTLSAFAKKSDSEVIAELLKVHEKLTEIDTHKLLPLESYVHLEDSIRKIVEYSQAEIVQCRKNPIAAKSFFFLNESFVKMLRDTVGNYQTSLRAILADFVEKSAVFFYTQGVFDEVKHDDFSWKSFDSNRLKAMDFVIEWKDGMREKISSDTLKMVKAVMLALHVINYLSIFKFLVLDASFFDQMDETLKNNLHEYFRTVAPFVQIIFVNLQRDDVVMQPAEERDAAETVSEENPTLEDEATEQEEVVDHEEIVEMDTSL